MINHVSVHNSVEEAVGKIRSLVKKYNFNPDYDDARVFQVNPGGLAEEVYSEPYSNDSCMENSDSA